MIPADVTKDDVLAAIARIDQVNWEKARNSRKWDLVHEGKNYPPKVVVSEAVGIRSGTKLDPKLFSGGVETNNWLKKRGFVDFRQK